LYKAKVLKQQWKSYTCYSHDFYVSYTFWQVNAPCVTQLPSLCQESLQQDPTNSAFWKIQSGKQNKIGAIKKKGLNLGTKFVWPRSLISGTAPENPGQMVTLSFHGE